MAAKKLSWANCRLAKVSKTKEKPLKLCKMFSDIFVIAEANITPYVIEKPSIIFLKLDSICLCDRIYTTSAKQAVSIFSIQWVLIYKELSFPQTLSSKNVEIDSAGSWK